VDTAAFRAWASAERRPLAVRELHDPWAVLVVEVMSQQTRIDRVEAFAVPFLECWPTPERLAAASTRDLLAAWAGLGYNRRALALREAARTIVERHGGHLRADVAALEALPGVGPYTARAVAASAFGMPVAPLDVNVRRVVSRLAGPSVAPRDLQAYADALVWADDPRAWVEAVMDLAVAVCTPDPRCDSCPLAGGCASRGIATHTPRPRPPGSFPATRRWLRGELLRRARGVGDGEWLTLDRAVGPHGLHAVREAAASLVAESFLEVHPESDDLVRIASR
jgi:A/G-specific adenine glycosylase